MKRKISYGKCYSVLGGKTDFYAPSDGTFLYRQSGPGLTDATDYGFTGKDYLSPATSDAGAPGNWFAAAPLHVPWSVTPANGSLDGIPGRYPDYPWMFNSALFNFGVSSSTRVGTANNLIPWPLPCDVIQGGNGIGYTIRAEDFALAGLKFVDQFGNDFPIGVGINRIFDAAVGWYLLGGTSFQFTLAGDFPGYVAIDNYLDVSFTFYVGFDLRDFAGNGGGLVGVFNVPDIKRPDKTRLLPYPKFTWDGGRMAAIAAYFNAIPAKATYGRGPGGIVFPIGTPSTEFVTVDGTMAVDPNQISYGPMHFNLNRPPCKYAGILNPCS